MSEERTTFEGWAILELMGHVKLGGFIRETTLAGGGVLRIDIPGEALDSVYATQFVNPSSLYRMTPCTEAAARAVAAHNRPQPVASWELPKLSHREIVQTTTDGVSFDDDEYDEDPDLGGEG